MQKRPPVSTGNFSSMLKYPLPSIAAVEKGTRMTGFRDHIQV